MAATVLEIEPRRNRVLVVTGSVGSHVGFSDARHPFGLVAGDDGDGRARRPGVFQDLLQSPPAAPVWIWVRCRP